MKNIFAVSLVVLLGCASASKPAPVIHVDKALVKSAVITCTDTLENCSHLVYTICNRPEIPMLAEGPVNGVFTVSFDCKDN